MCEVSKNPELSDQFSDLGDVYLHRRNLLNTLYFSAGTGSGVIICDNSDKKAAIYVDPRMPAILEIQKWHSLLQTGQIEELLSELYPYIDKTSFDKSTGYFPKLQIYLMLAFLATTYLNECGVLDSIDYAETLSESLAEAVSTPDNGINRLIRLMERMVAEQKNISSDEKSTVVYNIKNYVINNLNKDLSLVQLGDITNLCPAYLSRLFKEYANINLLDYIINLRIEKSKELLFTTNLRIKEIADMTGFGSSSYFITQFKRRTNLTPQEWRDKSGQKL